MRSRADVDAMIASAVQHFGSVDILVANAGGRAGDLGGRRQGGQEAGRPGERQGGQAGQASLAFRGCWQVRG